MQSLGVFGGTFDPPHITHLILANEALIQLSLERVLWVLTPVPPHKPDRVITPLIIRKQMLEAAINDNSSFELSEVEINRKPPHYAADTMYLLKEVHPGAEFIYLMGEDSLRDLPGWYQPNIFIQRCKSLGIFRRPGVKVDVNSLKLTLPGLEHKILYIDVPLLDISSTDIRRRVAKYKSFRYYLPEKVYQLVLKYHLYQE